MNNFSQTDASPSFEERHVEGGRVEVDKLEDEHLEDEGVVVLRLCAVHLCEREKKKDMERSVRSAIKLPSDISSG